MVTRSANDSVRDLRFRIRELDEQVHGAVVVGEMRTTEQVHAAIRALVAWVKELAEEGEYEGATLYAWAAFQDEWPFWARGDSSIEEQLGIKADPPWLLDEFLAVVALYLVTLATMAVNQRPTVRTIAMAGMYYADAVECFTKWREFRGNGGCRNPYEPAKKLKEALERVTAAPYVFDEILKQKASRRETASAGGRARKSTREMQDQVRPKFEAWSKGIGPHKGKTQAKFLTAMETEHPNLSRGSVEKAIGKWRKEGKASK